MDDPKLDALSLHVNEIKTLSAESGGESRLQLPHTQRQYGAFSRLNGIIAENQTD
jgi:hypothetical protein